MFLYCVRKLLPAFAERRIVEQSEYRGLVCRVSSSSIVGYDVALVITSSCQTTVMNVSDISSSIPSS